jgi:hypothetical protein
VHLHGGAHYGGITGRVLGEDRVAGGYALVADEDLRSGNEALDLLVCSAAEGAGEVELHASSPD